jgi:hypothetical protein
MARKLLPFLRIDAAPVARGGTFQKGVDENGCVKLLNAGHPIIEPTLDPINCTRSGLKIQSRHTEM